ncbi:MAG: tetratricopeptide repeat protein [Saprospiraceae bacterium]
MFISLGETTARQIDSLSQVEGNFGVSVMASITDHNKRGNKFLEAKEYDKAEKEFNLALKYAKEINNIEEEAFIYSKLGIIYQRRNKFEQALVYFIKIESIPLENTVIDSCKIFAKSCLGGIYQQLGDYEKAYDYQLEVLQVHERDLDTLNMGRSHYRIGCIFYYQNNYEEALKHYEITLKFVEGLEHDDKKIIFSVLAALGSTNEKLGKMESAIDFNLQSLVLAKEVNDTSWIAYAMLNSGGTFLANKSFGRATSYLNEAKKLMIIGKDEWGLVGIYRGLAELYIKTGVPQKSIEYLKSALPIVERLDSKVRFLELYSLFAEAYREIGDFEQAFAYQQKFIELKEKVLNETTLKEMGNQKTRYEVQKKENEIVLLKKENDLLAKDQEIGKLYRGIFIGAGLFLLMLLSLIFSRYQVQKQSNKLLSDKNTKINSQKEQLEIANKIQSNTNTLLEDKNIQIELQNKQLEHSNEDLKQFAYVASHDLKEPLRMISSYTSILKKRYNPLFDDDAHEFMGYIVDAVGRMETLLSDLLVYSRVSTQEKAFKEVEIRDIVDIVMGTLRYSIEEKGAKVLVNSSDLPRIKASHTQMIQLFQNLMSNAIKFTKESDPRVHVDCIKQNDHYLFSVKDNGIGISESNKDKIFEMFKRLHTKEEFEGTGIGLATCKKIVDRHGGDIWVDSTPGEGSTFYFKIPLLLDVAPKVENNQNKLIQEMSN